MSKLSNKIIILSLSLGLFSCATTKKVESVRDVKTVVAKGHIAELSDRTARKAIKQNPVTVVEVSAEWCKSCKTATDALYRVAWKNRGKYLISIIDEKNGQKFMKKYDVESFPTFFIFENGLLVQSFVGAGAVSSIDSYLDDHAEKLTAFK